MSHFTEQQRELESLIAEAEAAAAREEEPQDVEVRESKQPSIYTLLPKTDWLAAADLLCHEPLRRRRP